jgi:hypothetical protein
VTASTWLAATIATEKLNEFENPIQSSFQCPTQPRGPLERKQATMDNDETDVDNTNFTVASSTEDGLDNNSDIMEISNEEVRI